MPRPIFLALLVVAIASIAACSKAAAADQTTPRGTVDAWIAAAKAKDKEALLALGTPEWAEKERTWKKSFTNALFEGGWELVSAEVREPSIEGDTANVSARAQFMHDGKPDGEGLRFTLVLKNGRWLITTLG